MALKFCALCQSNYSTKAGPHICTSLNGPAAEGEYRQGFDNETRTTTDDTGTRPARRASYDDEIVVD